MNLSKYFIFVIPGCHYQAPQLCLEVVFEAGDVPVLEVVAGEVALQGRLEGLQEEEEEQGEDLTLTLTLLT